MEDSFFYTPETMSKPAITKAQFNSFHSIDRILYTRITCFLRRDPAQSVQVMALWLWLEHLIPKSQLVNKIRSTFTDPMLSALLDEAVTILSVVESDEFPYIGDDSGGACTSFTQMLTGNTAHTLKYFHDNRLAVIRGVMKNVHEVCMRAFEDIFDEAMKKYQPKDVGNKDGDNKSGNMDMHGMFRGFDPYDLEYQRKILNDNASDVLNSLQISPDKNEKNDKKEDKRTLFLTFSNGYRLNENEVREFFTMRFGDCVEAIYMQNKTTPEEQPKYARLVVKHPSTLDVVLSGNKKVQFIIKGKQVNVRKYLSKGSPSKSSLKPNSPML